MGILKVGDIVECKLIVSDMDGDDKDNLIRLEVVDGPADGEAIYLTEEEIFKIDVNLQEKVLTKQLKDITERLDQLRNTDGQSEEVREDNS